MIQRMYPTSKIGLKQMCLMASNGDLEKAEKLYDFMIKDLDDLPIFDPVQPSTLDQVKSGVNGTMQWLKDNQDELFVAVDLLKGFFGKKNGGGGVPPAAAASTNPIPSINQ